MRIRVRLLPVVVLLVLAGLAASAVAGAKTKTITSGNINRPIPDPVGGLGFEIGPSVKVERRGRVKDVNVAVRITHPDARELEIGASHIPANGVLRLTQLKELGQLSQPGGADFGAGAPTCQGAAFTVFDSQAPTSIFQGAPPFASTFAPASSLSVFNGTQLRGRWYLDLLDSTSGDAGVLNCWQITIRYKPARKQRS